ncbi:MAG: DUF2933 domain-containing protein [Candidatus Rokuibacteriota bacterium]
MIDLRGRDAAGDGVPGRHGARCQDGQGPAKAEEARMRADERPIERQGSTIPPSNGEPAVREDGYCAYCGSDLDGASGLPMRFGERFCSDGHADAFVLEARAARIESAAIADRTDAASLGSQASSGWNLKRALKMGVCCGLPLLALVFLVGGGGALLGAGSAVLPLLAILACPLGMFFMMRAMQGHGKGDNEPGADRPSPSKELKKR